MIEGAGVRFLFSGLLLFSVLLPRTAGGQETAPLSRIAFGSCAGQDQPQPIWDAVVEANPQLFLFLGDNIYGDSEDMDVLRAKYQLLADQPGYRKLKQTCPVLATWDDHDYGADDAGVEYPMKRQSQRVFLDFFEVPADSPRRTREGIYDAQLFGPADQHVQVILLDTRYFRSPLVRGFEPGEPGEGRRGRYLPTDDPSATMLGEAQWKWLEQQLRTPARLRIICSSVQVIANDHGWETWGNFPHERQRLFRLIRDTGASGVIFISGDRHLAEISCLEPAKDGEATAAYPLFDVTSSSLNRPSNNITKSGARFVNELNSHRRGVMYLETNFGFIDIDWSEPDPVIRLQVRDETGGVVLQQRLRMSELE